MGCNYRYGAAMRATVVPARINRRQIMGAAALVSWGAIAVLVVAVAIVLMGAH